MQTRHRRGLGEARARAYSAATLLPTRRRAALNIIGEPTMPLSYVSNHPDSPWNVYLMQVDRVVPYLGKLSRWAETLKRPKRTLIVDIPIEMDDGSISHFEGYRSQHSLTRGSKTRPWPCPMAAPKAASASIRKSSRSKSWRR
jgi:hypothetical protein